MTQHVPTLGARLRLAFVPNLRFALASALVLLIAIGASLYANGYAAQPRTGIALAILTLPPAVVAGIAGYVIDAAIPRAGRIARGFSMAFALATFGVLASAGVFSLAYRATYPVAFQPIWTDIGFHQLAWTGIATLYLFAVTGVRLLLPWGPVAAIGLAAWYALRVGPALRPGGKPARDDAVDRQTSMFK
jgi:hypothetical protein